MMPQQPPAPPNPNRRKFLLARLKAKQKIRKLIQARQMKVQNVTIQPVPTNSRPTEPSTPPAEPNGFSPDNGIGQQP